ncbi:MAG: response regulator [Myxococcales bacterium]
MLRGVTSTRQPPIEVFVADEDEELRTKVAKALREVGCEVVACCDGMSLFSQLRERLSHPNGRRSVVVAQGQLPVLGALQILHSLRRLDLALPFIFMTRLDQRAVRETAERAGASAFLLKPFPMDQLVRLVASLSHSGH